MCREPAGSEPAQPEEESDMHALKWLSCGAHALWAQNDLVEVWKAFLTKEQGTNVEQCIHNTSVNNTLHLWKQTLVSISKSFYLPPQPPPYHFCVGRNRCHWIYSRQQLCLASGQCWCLHRCNLKAEWRTVLRNKNNKIKKFCSHLKSVTLKGQCVKLANCQIPPCL